MIPSAREAPMPWHIEWDYGPGGNVDHIARHDLTPGDVEHVLLRPARRLTSRSSGRPMAAGRLADGRYVVVVYERLPDGRVYPVTAYEPD